MMMVIEGDCFTEPFDDEVVLDKNNDADIVNKGHPPIISSAQYIVYILVFIVIIILLYLANMQTP
jgi:hypothetical protein